MKQENNRRSGSARSGRGGKGPSQRQLRVGEVVRQVLSEELGRGDLLDPDLSGVSITVSEVRPSPDMRHAKVYCVPLGGLNTERVIAALNRVRAPLQAAVGRGLTLKFTPRLEFVEDTSFAEAQKITTLLRAHDRPADQAPTAEPEAPREDD